MPATPKPPRGYVEFVQRYPALAQQGWVRDVPGRDALAIVPFYPGFQQIVKRLIENDAGGPLHRLDLSLGQRRPQAQARRAAAS